MTKAKDQIKHRARTPNKAGKARVYDLFDFMLLAPPVGGRTAREWSRAEPRVLVYG